MKKPWIVILIGILCSFSADKPAYKIFDKEGVVTSYQQLLNASLKSDIVLFGELHNNPIVHWLQLELTKDLHTQLGQKLILGAEMFEADDQLILNEYLNGRIKDSQLDAEAKLWPNYNTDYKPLLDFAKKNTLNFIATNIPRRYAAMVSKSGFEVLDSLNPEARNYFMPLPVAYDAELPCYKTMLKMGGGPMGHKNLNLPKAQAVKDATMAYFILKNYQKGNVFLHYNGTYHSENYEGIVWYLRKANPKLKILTIASVEQTQLDSLEAGSKSIADFVLITPESMTKTH